jgi:hypothetical protein
MSKGFQVGASYTWSQAQDALGPRLGEPRL